MAIQVGTDVPTLHRALTELVTEGLLTRTPRIGTHVAQWEKGLLRLGIYHSRGFSSPAHSFAHRLIETEVQRLASQMKISVQVWTDSRPASKQGVALPGLEYAARERVIQGLISTDGDETHWKWFQKLTVPVATLGSASGSLIDFDHANFFELAAASLRKQGCRSVALLGAGSPSRFRDSFLAACEKSGLTTLPEWAVSSSTSDLDHSFEHAGYTAFKTLWRQSRRPDGLIVYPDVFSTGVVMGIYSAGVQVPKDLKLVLHRNAEGHFFCPFDATLITSRMADAARALIQQLDSVLKGREPKRVLIEHEAVANRAS